MPVRAARGTPTHFRHALPLQPLRRRRCALLILDQTELPFHQRYLRATRAREVAAAIRRLAVRGAPAIGIAAAHGMALDALRLPEARLWGGLVSAAAALKAARPTATNLAWAVDRVLGAALARSGASAMRRAADREAGRVEREEHARSLAIARAGVGLMPRDATVLTICNTGPLAAPPLGTALGVVLLAHRQGLRPRVYACETRPLLQGARLTAFELSRAGVPVTLIVDSAAASVIDRCDLVLVGADRIARNGDTANKVGTRMLAQLAQGNRKPFYVAAPLSTFDLSLRDGSSIPIEERDPDEVRRFRSCSVAPARVAAFNPAFDVTPARFIDGFITDAGLIRPPCSRSIVAASRGR